MSVGEVTNLIAHRWGSDLEWLPAPDAEFHEASLLALDSRRATSLLGWQNLLNFRQAVEWTVDWYKAVRGGEPSRDCSLVQISAFEALRAG